MVRLGETSPKMSQSQERPKRRRASTQRHEVIFDAKEERMLQLALKKSKVETQRRHVKVPPAKTFYPTVEEFAQPLRYIQSIVEKANSTGVCKIVPPKGWNPPPSLDFNNDTIKFGTRIQRVHQLQEGKYYDEGRRHTFKSYQQNAHKFFKSWCEKKGWDVNKVDSDEVEKEYWRIVETMTEEVEVEYGNDLNTKKIGSGFELPTRDIKLEKKLDQTVNFHDRLYYRNCGWNVNNISQWPGSLLRHITAPVNGVNIPWLYCGMLFASFCWHTEDNHLYSINYMHHGAKKRWYGIPASSAIDFEKVMRRSVPERFREDPDLLFHLVTMVSPATLQANDVPVYTLLQEPGDIVITLPKAYHGGFSEGFNCNEAVNFALPDWLDFGKQCNELYRSHGRLSVFSHDRLICLLTQHLEEYDEEIGSMLLRELDSLIEEEIALRRNLMEKGICQVIQMPRNSSSMDEASMLEDDRRQCCFCRHSCYVSGIVCKCSSSRISCLRHDEELCNCPTEEKSFVIWESIENLENMVCRVKKRLGVGGGRSHFRKKQSN